MTGTSPYWGGHQLKGRIRYLPTCLIPSRPHPQPGATVLPPAPCYLCVCAVGGVGGSVLPLHRLPPLAPLAALPGSQARAGSRPEPLQVTAPSLGESWLGRGGSRLLAQAQLPWTGADSKHAREQRALWVAQPQSWEADLGRGQPAAATARCSPRQLLCCTGQRPSTARSSTVPAPYGCWGVWVGGT